METIWMNWIGNKFVLAVCWLNCRRYQQSGHPNKDITAFIYWYCSSDHLVRRTKPPVNLPCRRVRQLKQRWLKQQLFFRSTHFLFSFSSRSCRKTCVWETWWQALCVYAGKSSHVRGVLLGKGKLWCQLTNKRDRKENFASLCWMPVWLYLNVSTWGVGAHRRTGVCLFTRKATRTLNFVDGRVAGHLGAAVGLKTLSIHVCVCPHFGM